MPKSTREDRNVPYLAVLVEKRSHGHQQLHAGLARHGIGHAMCDDPRPFFEFPLAARDENYALYRPAGWRHRYTEAFLELNRGCKQCLDVLYQVGKEVGYAEPKGLKT